MHTPQSRFFFNEPPIGQTLLRHAKRLRIDILHLEACDDDESLTLCDVELHAAVPLSGDDAGDSHKLLRALLGHFLVKGGQ